MISKELYNLVIEADKETENNGRCDTCFCFIFKSRLQGSVYKHFLNWKAKNKGCALCGSVLFYLQDLGIIKILSGVHNRTDGVSCKNLKYTITKQILGNKIWNKKRFIK